MRSIFAGIIMLSASMAAVHPAQAEKHGYMQSVIGHRQPIQARRDKTMREALAEARCFGDVVEPEIVTLGRGQRVALPRLVRSGLSGC
jgi:hypothetical protein